MNNEEKEKSVEEILSLLRDMINEKYGENGFNQQSYDEAVREIKARYIKEVQPEEQQCA